MAPRKQAATPKAGEPVNNDFSMDEAVEYFDRLDEINDRKNADVASANSDMSGVYDSMVEKLGIDKEAAKFLWARHNAENRFQKRAAKGDVKTRKSFERFAKACEGTPMGDWALAAAGQITDTATTVSRSTKKKDEPAAAPAAQSEGEKSDEKVAAE